NSRGRSPIRHAITTLVFAVLLSSDAWCALTVILVRHAEVTDAASDPSLSSQGQSRAELLASMLPDAHLDAIYVTEYRRTQQTAQPAAGRFHLRPERVDSGNIAALADAIRRHTSGTVLVIGHTNTVPAIVSMLGGPSVRIRETEFDNLFIVTLTTK